MIKSLSHEATKEARAGAKFTGKSLLAAQALVLTLAAVTFALLPVADEPVVLVPLAGNTASELIGAELRLIGPGRLPNSLIVSGSHPSFFGTLVGKGILTLPAVPLLCGSPLESSNS